MSEMREKQTVSLRLVPGEGAMLSASTIGGTLVEASKLFGAIAKSHGHGMNAVVSGLQYDNGAVTINLLLTTIPKRRAARKQAR
jgi:hypothetical protein